MTISRRGLALGSMSMLAAAGALVAPAAAVTVPRTTPNVGVCNQLNSTSALSATNVWAVGSYCSANRVERSLAMHYNGTSWRIISTPDVGSVGSSLADVAAISRTNVWAVGTYSKGTQGNFRTLVEHWNGRAWRVVSSPNVGTGMSVLRSVTAVSARNIWAVGYWGSASGSTGGALIEHWNGTAWKVVKAPTNTTFKLHGVSAVAANDIWATGERGARRVTTLALHWDGTAWRVVPTPIAGSGNNFFEGGVKAISSTDVWGVGWYAVGTSFRPLAVHWNGAKWSIVATPHRTDSYLYAVDGTSAGNVWAVGTSTRTSRTFVEHWNGSTWSVVASPSPGSRSNELYAVAAVSPTRAFAVGYRSSTATGSRTLVLRWGGSAWRVM